MKIAIGAAMLSLPLALLISASAAQSEDQATNSKVDQDNRMVCKTVKETGSRLARRRTCMTQSEWTLKNRADKEAARDASSRQVSPTEVDPITYAREIKNCPRC